MIIENGAVLIPILGLLFGSFGTVLTSRTLSGESFIMPASYCDTCKEPLNRWYLIPIFSYAFQRGKSICCRERISTTNVLTEIVTSLLFFISYKNSDSIFELLVLCIFATVSMPLLLIDLAVHRLPNRLTFPAFIFSTGLVTAYAVNNQDFQFLSKIFMTLLIIFGVFFLIFIASRGGMGLGDLKLSLLIGVSLAFKSADTTITTFVCAFVSGAFVGLYLIITKKEKMKGQIPFGPYLIIGLWIAVTLGATTASRVTDLWRIH